LKIILRSIHYNTRDPSN